MNISKNGLITESKVMVIQHLIPLSNKTSRPNVKMIPQSITIHNTGNPDADALDNSKYVDTATGYVSWHFSVGDNRVYQELPIYEHSWHAGDGEFGEGNLTSIAIEISEEEGDKAYRTAIKFVAELLLALDWGIDKLRTHQSWSGKYCPRLILPKWDSDFIPKIKQEMDRLEKEGDIMIERIDIKIKGSDKIIKELEKETIEKVSPYLDLYEVLEKEEALYSYCGYALKKGIKNDTNNSLLQEALKELGCYNMAIDTSFGNGTHNGVINFQADNGLDVTGIVTENVSNEINKALIEKRSTVENPTQPDTSEFDNFKPLVKLIKPFGYYTKFGQTRPVQFMLNEIDKVKYDIEVDGHFGRGSQSALNTYKKSKGLPQDGLVDELTWKHLHYDLWKKQEGEDLKINWYDNQTKVIRVEKDEVDFDVIMGRHLVESVKSVYNRLDEKPVLIFNGTMFGLSNGMTLGLVQDEGKTVEFGYYSKWFIGQSYEDEIKMFGGNWEKQIHGGSLSHIKEGIGASPSLLVGGKKNVDNTGLDYGFINYKHPRLVLGLDDEYIYVIIVHGRNSLKGYYGENINGLVDICLDLNMTDALNLDGGGSVSVYGSKGNRIDDNTSIRRVDNMVALFKR